MSKEAIELMDEVLESIRCRIFSYNKAIGKSQMELELVNEPEEYKMAKYRLSEALVELALKESEID